LAPENHVKIDGNKINLNYEGSVPETPVRVTVIIQGPGLQYSDLEQVRPWKRTHRK